MPVAPARAAAFDILLRVEREQAYASELLHSSRLDKLSPQDRALCTELVMGVLRWQSLLDHNLARFSSKPVERLDLEVTLALRLALYQLSHLTRVPGHAVVNDSVELVKRAKKRSAAPFVNAVLRRAIAWQADAGNRALPPKRELSLDERLEVIATGTAHPLWLLRRWAAEFGLEAIGLMTSWDMVAPQPALRLADASLEAELAGAGVELAPGSVLVSARRVRSGEITATAAFREGRVAIQDEASQLVALLVGHGARILDCCAAPGGKTAILAEQNPTASIVAADLHPHRARLLRRRLRAANVQVLAADACALPLGMDFDRILADVPCSGTGTLARHPEIKWRLKPEDLAGLQQRQLAIVDAVAQRLAPGGRLVYSTCSLETEENEAVVEQLLGRRPQLRLLDCREDLLRLRAEGQLREEVDSLLRGKFLRTVPGVHRCDGFFAAILERAG